MASSYSDWLSSTGKVSRLRRLGSLLLEDGRERIHRVEGQIFFASAGTTPKASLQLGGSGTRTFRCYEIVALHHFDKYVVIGRLPGWRVR
jgi:hypothetical protein